MHGIALIYNSDHPQYVPLATHSQSTLQGFYVTDKKQVLPPPAIVKRKKIEQSALPYIQKLASYGMVLGISENQFILILIDCMSLTYGGKAVQFIKLKHTWADFSLPG